MIDEIIGKEIVSYEVFEPWCLSTDAQLDGRPVFGALALHTSGAVLTLSSRLRFANLPEMSDASHGLVISAMDSESWSLQRARWLERSELSGPRPVSWYRHTARTVEGVMGTPFLPIRPGLRIADVSLRPDGLDAVALRFEEVTAPVVFEYWPDFDGGLGWTAGVPKTLEVISPFLPIGEFAWLHPATPIPVQYEGFTLRSALFEDWPLMLRRSIVDRQELPSGKSLRRSAQLLATPHLRAPYLRVVQMLMALRFKQYPWLRRRLLNLHTTVADAEEFGNLVNQALPSWQAFFAKTAA